MHYVHREIVKGGHIVIKFLAVNFARSLRDYYSAVFASELLEIRRCRNRGQIARNLRTILLTGTSARTCDVYSSRNETRRRLGEIIDLSETRAERCVVD